MWNLQKFRPDKETLSFKFCIAKAEYYIHTLKRGFNFFCKAELRETFNEFKLSFGPLESLNTTAITNLSGPPPGGGTPTAAVSRILSSTALQTFSISTELTWQKES